MLSGEGELRTDWLCMIGPAGSWLWVDASRRVPSSDLTEVITQNYDLRDADSVLYILPPQFEPPIAFTLLDAANVWEHRNFKAQNAAASSITGTDGKSWRRLRPLPDDSELQQSEVLVPGAWDHEHCQLCNKHIYPDAEYFSIPYAETGRFFLCPFCYERFGATHSIDEVIYPGQGDRVGEPD